MTQPAYRLVRRPSGSVAVPELDEAQRAVVEHGGGPLLVLAGPGTGKTSTLVEAAVARVEAGVPIDQILMLTFSRRAAGELRERVTARLQRTVREPIARTLHSYAFGVLRMANVAAGLPAPRLLSASEQDIIIRDLVGGRDPSTWPESLRPALGTRAFAGELRDLIMRAIERGLDADALVEFGTRRRRADWVAAGEFLREYHAVYAMRDPGAYDPAELISTAYNVLSRDTRLLNDERARRRHLFVDEYQDTDPAQARLLQLLAAGAEEIVLVGDPDQSIYGFRGADSAAMSEVEGRFGPGVPVVALTVCRRSGPGLLAASRRIAHRLPGPAAQRALTSVAGCDPGHVQVEVFRSSSEEAAFVAASLRRAHLDGMPFSRMAVLVRSTAISLATLRRALTTAGVPLAVRGEDLPLAEQPAVAMVLDVLDGVLACEAAVATSTDAADAVDRAVAGLGDDRAERLLLGPIGGGDPVYLRRLRRVLRHVDATEFGFAPAVLDPLGAAMLPDGVRRPVQQVADVIAAGRRALREGTAEDVLWAIWDGSGLARRWERASRAGGPGGAAADRDLDAVVELFATAARFVDRLPQATAEQFAEHLAAQQLPGDAQRSVSGQTETVSILTAHASKGLEWDLVCVAGVQEGGWPDLRRRGSLLGSELLVDALSGRDAPGVSQSARQLAEERRLFYVAVTRARQRVIVSAVSGEEEQPSRFLDELDPLPDERPYGVAPRGVHLPSVVAELRAVVTDPDDPRGRAAAAALSRLAAAGVPGADPITWWGLASLSDDRPMSDPGETITISPSKIDSFLRCELRALLEDLGARDGNLVSASLGTLVHNVAAAAPAASVDELERLLDEHWRTIDFGASWFSINERLRAAGFMQRLAAWLQESRATLELVAVEEPFDVEFDDVRLRGRVDRLERDRRGRLVVVDLKTGKSKPSATDIPEHPQLGAYQLAVELGAFSEIAGSEEPGGAMLVQLATTGDTVQGQGALAESENPDWARETVASVAAVLRGTSFRATIGPDCRHCGVRLSCPLQPEGRGVVE